MSMSENSRKSKNGGKGAKNTFSIDVAAQLDEMKSNIQESIPPLFLASEQSSSRRMRCQERFNELSDVIVATDPAFRSRFGIEDHPPEDYFPTLQVGYVARAMGLNLNNVQVVRVVELVEDDAASRGSVSRRRLAALLVDAVMTGVIGSPSLMASGVIPLERFEDSQPICCVRDDEERIFKAFQVLDAGNKGHLEETELRVLMTTMGEPFSSEETEEMMLAMLDPEAGVVYYRDFVDELARE